MKSKTKNLLTEDEIKYLVKVNFGSSCEVGGIEELKGGMFNSIYLIHRLHEKDSIVLKVGVIPGTTLLTYEQDVMPTEVECYRMIREKTTVPVPSVLACDFSKEHIKSNYFFMSTLTGVTLQKAKKKMTKENLNKIQAELAGYLAQLHEIKGPYFGYFSEDTKKQYPTWRKAFFRMFQQILEDAREHQVRIPYGKIEAALRNNAGYLDELLTPALVEYDCHEGNVFVKKCGDEYVIEGILDFERAFWGDPIADFPTAFVFTDDIRKEKAFLEGYLKAAGKDAYTEADAVRYQFYRLYITVIMAAETFRYDFPYSRIQGMWAKYQIRKCLKALGQ